MEKLTLELGGSDISMNEISKIEKQYRIKFPDDYKNFMIIQNGGYSRKYEFCKENNNFYLSNITPLTLNSEILGFASILTSFRENGIYPHYFIPIGGDDDSRVLSLSQREKDFGTVYIFDYDKEERGDDPIIFLASSFSEFLKGLTPRSQD